MSVWWLALPLGLGLWLYSWTFTPFGRIRFFPALICRAATLNSRFGKPISYSPADRKTANDNARKMMRLPIEATISERDITVTGDRVEVPVRLYLPAAVNQGRVIFNIHGGAYWMGNDYIDEGIMRHLCELSGAIIVSVDYRLAPEHPYPAAQKDCLAVWCWIQEHIAGFGGDPSRVVVYGTSAGGALAASLSEAIADDSDMEPVAQVLIVPITDLTDRYVGDSMAQMPTGFLLTARDRRDMIANYVTDPRQLSHPLVSPIYSQRLEGCPPTFIATAQYDPLRDQAKAYADKLQQAGVAVEYHCYAKVIHGFLGSRDVMIDCNQRVVAFIDRMI